MSYQKNAAIYARTAASQAHTNSALTLQTEQCKAYCTQNGYTLLNIYQEEGFSSTTKLVQAIREEVAQIERQQLIKLMQYGRAAKKARQQ